jgi:hypothetical protein
VGSEVRGNVGAAERHGDELTDPQLIDQVLASVDALRETGSTV